MKNLNSRKLKIVACLRRYGQQTQHILVHYAHAVLGRVPKNVTMYLCLMLARHMQRTPL